MINLNTDGPRFWKINPFGKFRYWDAWVKKGIMELGTWRGDENIEGNIRTKYKNVDKFNEITEIKNEEEYKPSYGNRYVQVRRFVWILKKGDILIPYVKGTIPGVGIAGDKYGYDDEEGVHWRDVVWYVFKEPVNVIHIPEIYNILKTNNTIMPLDDIKNRIIEEVIKEIQDDGIKKIITHGGNMIDDNSDILKILDVLSFKHQIILYGPPGTGKTYKTREFAVSFIKRYLIEDYGVTKNFKDFKEKNFIEFITFHPSYSYEEFIEGITVHTEREGESTKNVEYELRPGIFKTMCKRALGSAIGLDNDEVDNKTWTDIYNAYLEKRKEEEIDFDVAQKYVLIIDEINRGDISKIFGELITLLEKDKRLGAQNELTVKLPYSRDIFGAPPNLYTIATMNTADRSIALLDVALRRRFGFVEMLPDFSILENEYIEKNKEKLQEEGVYDLISNSKEALEKINARILENRSLGRDKQIGHSFLFDVETTDRLMMVWQYEILPLLDEYCYGNYEKITKILFNTEKASNWIKRKEGIVGFENVDDFKSFLKEIKGSVND